MDLAVGTLASILSRVSSSKLSDSGRDEILISLVCFGEIGLAITVRSELGDSIGMEYESLTCCRMAEVSKNPYDWDRLICGRVKGVDTDSEKEDLYSRQSPRTLASL